MTTERKTSKLGDKSITCSSFNTVQYWPRLGRDVVEGKKDEAAIRTSAVKRTYGTIR